MKFIYITLGRQKQCAFTGSQIYLLSYMSKRDWQLCPRSVFLILEVKQHVFQYTALMFKIETSQNSINHF